MKWLKYRLKEQALRLSPDAYWSARHWLRGYLEPEIALLPRLCSKEELTIDVGANWGAYTYYSSRFSAHVHSFEPQPGLAFTLQQGVGRRPNVTVRQLALSNRVGTSELRVPKNDIGYATIEAQNALVGTADLSRGLSTVEVNTCRLDDLDLTPVAFVKIDVEGHELEVLEGARATLERDTPTVLVEVEDRHRSGAVASVTQLLRQLDYDCCVHHDGKLQPATKNATSRNLLFLHPRRVPSLAPLLTT